MSESAQHEHKRTCGSIGYLLVGGKKVGLIRCDREPGHDVAGPSWIFPIERRYNPAKPHRAVLEWSDEDALAESWPEAMDPDEPADVVVPLVDLPSYE